VRHPELSGASGTENPAVTGAAGIPGARQCQIHERNRTHKEEIMKQSTSNMSQQRCVGVLALVLLVVPMMGAAQSGPSSSYPVFVADGEDWSHCQSRPAEGQPPELDNWRITGDLYHSSVQAYRGNDDWVEYSFDVPPGIYQVSVKAWRYIWGNNEVDVMVDGEHLGSIDLCTFGEGGLDYGFVWYDLGLAVTTGSPAVVRLQDSPDDPDSWWIKVAEVKLIGIASALYGDEWLYSRSRPAAGEDPEPDNWRNLSDRSTVQAYRGEGDYVEYELSVPPGSYEVMVKARRYIWGNEEVDVLLDGTQVGSIDLCTADEDDQDYGFIWFSLGTATSTGFPARLRLQDSPTNGLSWWIKVAAVALVPEFPTQDGDQWTHSQSRPDAGEDPEPDNWRNFSDHAATQLYRGTGDWVEYTFDVPTGSYDVYVKAKRYIWGNDAVDVLLDGTQVGSIDLCTDNEDDQDYGYVWYQVGVAATGSSPAVLRLEDSPAVGYSWWIRVAEVALVPVLPVQDGEQWTHSRSRPDAGLPPEPDNWRNLSDHAATQAYRGDDDWVEYTFTVPSGSYDVYVKARRYIWGNDEVDVVLDGTYLGSIDLCTYLEDDQDYGYVWYNMGTATTGGASPVLRIEDSPANGLSWWIQVREVALIPDQPGGAGTK
jgi:hypothetical protein